MSTHIIHRVEGDLAPPVNFELVGQDITGWTIQLQGTYRETFQPIDIPHTVDVAADGKGHFDWGATDLIKGVADWEIFFTPSGGSPKTFTIPAENSLLLQVRGKKEPGPGVLSGGGDQITIDQDGRTLKIFGGDGGGGGVVLFTTQVSLLASTLDDGSIAYAEDTDTFFFRQAGVWQEQIDSGTIPGTIASVLTDHDKAAHDALGIDAATVGGVSLPGTIAAVLTDHDRAAHDALGTGNLVFEDETQTLTVKTLTSPILDLITSGSMVAQAAGFPSPDGNSLHLWRGTAGAIAATASSLLVLESNGAAALQFLTPNSVSAVDINFGDPESNLAGQIRYNHVADLFRFVIGGLVRLNYSSGAFAFQQAMTISTVGGDLTLAPSVGTKIIAGTPTAIGAIIQGAAAQSANLTEWQDSASALLLSVDDNGDLLAGNADGPAILNRTSSLTVPTLIPDRGSPTFGIGGDGANLALIASGATVLSLNTSALAVVAGANLVMQGGASRIFDITKPLNLGDAATTTHGLVAGDVLVGDKFEVDGIAYFDNAIQGAGSQSANAQFMKVESASIELTGLTGASVTATNLIPAGSLVLGVSCRVTTAITGASTFDVGDGADVDRFGGAIAISPNTTSDLTDTTVATPPIYAGDTDVVLTANVSDFTAGAVRITVHYITISAPTS